MFEWKPKATQTDQPKKTVSEQGSTLRVVAVKVPKRVKAEMAKAIKRGLAEAKGE